MTKEKLIALLNAPEQVAQAVDELNRLVEEYPYFHTGHQVYIKSLHQTDLPKMEFCLNKAALRVRDRGVLYDYLNYIEKVVESKETEKKIFTPSDLIDSFLITEPKITASKDNKEFQAVDLSEKVQENNDFCTETLADIYAMQGHKNKAIEIYEQLILKNPEKHIYFAAQIKRLKE